MKLFKFLAILLVMVAICPAKASGGTMDNYLLLAPDPREDLEQISYVDIYFNKTSWKTGVNVESTEGITLTYTSSDNKINRVYDVVDYEVQSKQLVELYFDLAEAEVKQQMILIEPGTYRLYVPAGAFSDAATGETNPVIETSYHIIEKDTHVTSVNLDIEPGAASDLSQITLDFPNKAKYHDFIESRTHWSSISLVRKGDNAVKYNCSAVDINKENYTVKLTFSKSGSTEPAQITEPGEYLLTVPAQVFGGIMLIDEINYAETNNALHALYTIAEPELDPGVMGTYTLDPAAGDVTSISSVKITFTETSWDGILIDDVSKITLIKDKGVEGKEEVYKVVRTQGGNSMQYCTMYFNYASSTSTEGITITAPGTYTLSIPAKSFHYDEWGATEYQYNAAITATYTINADDNNPMSQVSVTPASGSTVESITDIKLTFDTDAEINVNTAEKWASITLTQADETGFGSNDEYHCVSATANENTVTLLFALEGATEPVTILKKGEYALNVPKGIFSLKDDADRSNEGITAIYQIPYPTGSTELADFIITPGGSEGEAEVKEITDISITFPNAINGIAYPFDTDKITLTFTAAARSEISDQAGEVLPLQGADLKGNTVTLTYRQPNWDPRTEAGTYVLNIPQGTFQAVGNPNSVNSEITRKYIIGMTTGIEDVVADRVSADVYGIDGTIVLRNATSEEINALPAGIYITDGRKILVK